MKTRLVSLALATTLAGSVAVSGSARADDFSFNDVDKRAHIAASYGITFTVAAIARHYDLPRWQAIALAAATTIVVATTKELVLDDQYSWHDQLANAIGTTGAIGVVLAFRL